MVHRGFGTGFDHSLYRGGCPRHGLLNRRIYPATKQILGDGHAYRRASDADAYTNEVVTEMLDDGSKAVMATCPATDLYPHSACWKIQLIVHDDDLLGLIPCKCHPRVVHVCRWLEERDALEVERHRCDLGLFLRAPGATVTAGKLVSDEEANVVGCMLVRAPWIA